MVIVEENFPPGIRAGGEKVLRKLSLLEARMVGEASNSLEPSMLAGGNGDSSNDGNSTIGFSNVPAAEPEVAIVEGSKSGSRKRVVEDVSCTPQQDQLEYQQPQRLRRRLSSTSTSAAAAGDQSSENGGAKRARSGAGGDPNDGGGAVAAAPSAPGMALRQLSGIPSDADGSPAPAPAAKPKTIQAYFPRPIPHPPNGAGDSNGDHPELSLPAATNGDFSPPASGQQQQQPLSRQRRQRSTGVAAVAGGSSSSRKSSQSAQAVVPPSANAATAAAPGEAEVLRRELERVRVEAIALRTDAERAGKERRDLEAMASAVQAQLRKRDDEVASLTRDAEARQKAVASVLETNLRRAALAEARDRRDALQREATQLGRVVLARSRGGMGLSDTWEDGEAARELQERSEELVRRKAELEARKKAAAKASRAVAQAAAAAAAAATTNGATSGSGSSGGSSSSSGFNIGGGSNGGGGSGGGGAAAAAALQDELAAVEEEETVKMHLAALKRDEMALADERAAFERRKLLHQRELRRAQHEETSPFAPRPVLHDRYLLLSLLGKGGFSEVWKAFDMEQLLEVAVKVHRLQGGWSDAQKSSYVRHATREYEIHKQMRHPRVVRLHDVFEIDARSFATVLEYCRGTDLEQRLKEQRCLPEAMARAYLIQVMGGLRYLSTPQPAGSDGRQARGAVIHYDLKPANLLFDEYGDVKITDFGLSKILDQAGGGPSGGSGGPGGGGDTGAGTSMELTSQGAGTYWYLPPECFVTGAGPPRISSKVDVFSMGVIFYQMIYGVRPFAEGQTQDAILAQRLMLRADKVEFPDRPAVSAQAKDFIRLCLTHSQAERPDVLTLCQHPYLRTAPQRAPGGRGSKAAAATAAAAKEA